MVVTFIALFGSALVAYGAVYTHGNPHPQAGDPLLAARLIPLELLLGLLVAALVWRAFGRRQVSAPRPDAQERMVLRLALRRGGRFTLAELCGATPLSDQQARAVLARLLSEGRVRSEGDRYHLT